ncbi:PLP-dependent aminotransferase family protein [Microbacterium pseudoresistens]|uniref:DNA-binding transcriptional MocR family regulator n=1 Tax=Microbacterium pseudoresistens TaxID=640634 RepID=A0A7Y9EWC1_9MICO|nr:PLP-dependent aminotransferase family protein [Microbacterium pseudoresistens]NYD55168.1 DNA-binding transcriptional MocR family regulator [Microbacterium pseudoresistens]
MAPLVSDLPSVSQRAGSARTSPVRDLLALTERPAVISFAGGLPAPELFDVDGIRAAYDAVLSSPSVLQYSTSEGDSSLRTLVAAAYTADGVQTSADDLVITTGSQQGLGLLSTVLVDPGDVILVEEPCYLAALQTFALAGARIVAVPHGDDGIDLDALDRAAAVHAPKFFYIVPTFQNPTGRSHDVEARRGIAAIAEHRGFRIVEDEPYRQLRYEGTALPSLAAFAPDHVLSLGSFSKVIAPGLRIGWLRSTGDVRRAATIAKQAADLHTSTIDQAAAAHYLASGRGDAALDRIRTAYAQRRDAMLEALSAHLPAGSAWNAPEGGMFLWVRLPEGADATTALTHALAHDVAFVPGAPFYSGAADPRTLRLSFTTYAPGRIHEGIRRLGVALAG